MPQSWEELKVLLLKIFQPWYLTASYKAKFCAQRCRSSEEIYSYVEALQHLADMVWPFVDYYTKEDMVIDQFIQAKDNNELSIQMVASRCRCLETVLWVARSLEVVDEEEKHHAW